MRHGIQDPQRRNQIGRTTKRGGASPFLEPLLQKPGPTWPTGQQRGALNRALPAFRRESQTRTLQGRNLVQIRRGFEVDVEEEGMAPSALRVGPTGPDPSGALGQAFGLGEPSLGLLSLWLQTSSTTREARIHRSSSARTSWPHGSLEALSRSGN